MKKIFSLVVAALFAAVTINAAELTIDLANAAGYTHAESGSGAVQVADGVLTVTWTVGTAWEVAGTEIALDNLTDVSNISFDYKADGGAASLLVYLRDSEGNRWWNSSTGSLASSVTEWTAVATAPSAALWDGPSYAFGEHPFVQLGIVANPSAAVSGTFDIRNLKITCAGDEPVPAARPDTAMGQPAHEEADVMALYCNHYTTNNLNYDVQRWDATISWQVLKLGADSTNVYYTPAMTFEGLASNPIEARDFSAFKHLHFDVWVPDTVWISLTVETATGAKHHCPFRVNAGWNTIDADPAWWDKEGAAYDWKDVKFIIFDQYMGLDSTSYEGNPFAFANIYFWNEPAVVCPDAPADPTMAESKITALFAHNYKTNTLAFTPTSWGAQWVSPEGYEGAYFYTASFGWDCFTNWGASSYDLSAYDMFSCDIWVELDSKIKIGFESLKIDDGGTRNWKQGAHFDLQGNQWNHVEVDLLNAPYTTDNYDFSDMRYLVLDGFLKPDGTSAEGTPLGIANAYFWNSMDQGVENVEADKVAVKRLIDGRLVIEKNGKRYNALGTEF